MKVYTFYEPLAGQPNFWPLVRHWATSWTLRGWHACVLSIQHSRQHPRYVELVSALNRRPYAPLVGIERYDEVCFGRWFALAAVGGGLLTNYSVINYGYSPPGGAWKGISYFNGTTSSMIATDSAGADRIVRELISFVTRHCTAEGSQDMHCLTEFCWHNSAAKAALIPNVLIEFPARGPHLWGDPVAKTDWQTAPGVHYMRGSAHLAMGHERDWVGAIQKLRPI